MRREILFGNDTIGFAFVHAILAIFFIAVIPKPIKNEFKAMPQPNDKDLDALSSDLSKGIEDIPERPELSPRTSIFGDMVFQQVDAKKTEVSETAFSPDASLETEFSNYYLFRSRLLTFLGLPCIDADYAILDRRHCAFEVSDTEILLSNPKMPTPEQTEVFRLAPINSGLQPVERENSYLYAIVWSEHSVDLSILILATANGTKKIK